MCSLSLDWSYPAGVPARSGEGGRKPIWKLPATLGDQFAQTVQSPAAFYSLLQTVVY